MQQRVEFGIEPVVAHLVLARGLLRLLALLRRPR
jgi:hypothetical protein